MGSRAGILDADSVLPQQRLQLISIFATQADPELRERVSNYLTEDQTEGNGIIDSLARIEDLEKWFVGIKRVMSERNLKAGKEGVARDVTSFRRRSSQFTRLYVR